KILGTGNTNYYKSQDAPLHEAPRAVAYSSYDPKTQIWTDWSTLEQPDELRDFSISAGCAQRLDLPDGNLLLPVSFKAKGESFTGVKVLRCRFDGVTLSFIEEGPALRVVTRRGLSEPSLTRYRGKYLMTVRHNLA